MTKVAGTYDHVPPVPGHSNDKTDASLGTIPDISPIAVSPDNYNPCVPTDGTPTLHCDLASRDPRCYSRRCCGRSRFWRPAWLQIAEHDHLAIQQAALCVSITPMDHTAVIMFVESRFIGKGGSAHLSRTRCRTARPLGILRLQHDSMGYATNSAQSGHG